MTDTMVAAVSEINRVAAWALRGLGMAFAVADRAATLVGWAEAVEGGALKALRMNTPLLDEGPRPEAWHSQVSEASWCIDASGRSLLEVGPVAIDVLTLAARTGHVGRVDFANVMDPVFLSGVMRIAAKRSVGVVALSSDPCLSLCGVPVTRLHAYRGPHGPAFDEGGVPQTDAIQHAIAACHGQLKPGGQTAAAFSILSYSPAEAPASRTSASPRFDADCKHALAQSRGIPVERNDLTHLYQLEIRTWAPTSERSRKQALA